MTGLAFTQGSAGDLTSPSSAPVKLLALFRLRKSESSGHRRRRAAGGDRQVGQHFLRMAEGRTPMAQIEALIWQNDSVGGADHGESCAAFASLRSRPGRKRSGSRAG